MSHPSVVAGICLVLSFSTANADPVDFNRDIRPILSDACFACHGPAESARESELRLDTRAGAFADLGDGPAIIPGQPDESLLLYRLVTDDEDERMPPAESNKSLTEEQIALIRRWIEQGASYQEHWAFEAPVKAKPTEVASDWPESEIDHFVAARLNREGLHPQPEASREALIRRVTFDLTGLPPTMAEIDSFLNDKSTAAYENVVDRLLQSEHYGEHMARYWLDAARYGDTHGLHLDNYREVWPYRDWVVAAFNKNMPFDQFAIEQLAGDLLPDATLEQQIATGFNRCHVTTNEGGTIPEEFYVRNVIDRVDTMGQVFMGLTVGCAVCHEHKYDPISQHEYYQLFAFFNNLDGKAMDGNIKDHPPFVYIPTDEQKKTLETLIAKRGALETSQAGRELEIEEAFDAWVRWQRQLRESGSRVVLLGVEPPGLSLHFPLDGNDGAKVIDAVDVKKAGRLVGDAKRVTGQYGGAIEFSNEESLVDLGNVGGYKKKQQFSFGAWIRTPGDVRGAAISKMDQTRDSGYELQIDRRRVRVIMAASSPDLQMDVVTKADILKPTKWQHVFVTYDGSARAAGISIFVDGHRQAVEVKSDELGTFDFGTGKPLQLGRRDQKLPFAGGAIDDVRFYEAHLSDAEVAQIALASDIAPLLMVEDDTRSAEQTRRLKEFYLTQLDSAYRDQSAAIQQLREEETKLKRTFTTTLVFKEREDIRPAYLLERGEYDKKSDQTERITPAIFPPMADELPRNRLGLARWLTSPEHPLTARVTVNRLWQQVFGVGIVKTAEDFGSQGEPPSHPQLLDWLAVDFQEHGWNVKRLMKQLVMSATYRQSSVIPPGSLEVDPVNRLLGRGPRFRLDAEMLRDQALFVSGLLVPKLGGPSVKPPQPNGLWFAVGYSGSNTVRFKADEDTDKIHRRTLYTFIKRTAPPPQMSTFDAPSRESCALRRERTNTPLQALLLLNDPQYFEAARGLAQRALSEIRSGDQHRLSYMFRLCTGRRPDATVVSELAALLGDQRSAYANDLVEAKNLISVGSSPVPDETEITELAAWTMVANVMLNLDEVVNKN